MNEIFKLLNEKGIYIDKGLSNDEIKHIENIYSISFPKCMSNLFQEGIPIGKGFYNWRDFTEQNQKLINTMLKWPITGIQNNIDDVVWPSIWGKEPVNHEQRDKIILEKLNAAPKLIPVYSHRYISCLNHVDSPIISVYGWDIIYYGLSLKEYFEIEFDGKKQKDILNISFVKIPFWSDIM